MSFMPRVADKIVMLSVVMLSVVMLSVVILNVVALFFFEKDVAAQ
jgi:hypothetical protein